jgi:hypothetical protein
MNVLPTTGAAWSRLCLLPFKVYVVTAWLAARLYVSSAGRQFDTDVVGLVLLGYAVCFVALLVGGIVQRACGRREDSTSSFLGAGFAALAGWFLLPGLAKA